MPGRERLIDLPHAVPSRVAQAFTRQSVLAGGAGWCAVDPVTRRRLRQQAPVMTGHVR